MSDSAIYRPYEAPAREIAKAIIADRIPSNFPEQFRLLLNEVLVEGIHEGIEFSQGVHDPVDTEIMQGHIYLRGYLEGFEDGSEEV